MNSKLLYLIVSWLFFITTGLPQNSADSISNTVNQKSKSQQQLSALDIQRSAIKKAGFLAGYWEGTEWILMPDGRKQNCIAADTAEFKLNGTLILFRGGIKVKISPEAAPFVVYEGIGILTYDENLEKYRLTHFGTDGACEIYECTLSGRALHCERRDKDNAFVRITLGVDESGRWIERGERSQDGKTWTETFETQMSKAELK
jgi:hypothetical protein